MADAVPACEKQEVLDALTWNDLNSLEWVQSRPHLRMGSQDADSVMRLACSRGWHNVAGAVLRDDMSSALTTENMLVYLQTPNLRQGIILAIIEALERFPAAQQCAVMHAALTQAVRSGDFLTLRTVVKHAQALGDGADAQTSWRVHLLTEVATAGDLGVFRLLRKIHTQFPGTVLPPSVHFALKLAAFYGHTKLVGDLLWLVQSPGIRLDAFLEAVRGGQHKELDVLMQLLCDATTVQHALEAVVHMVKPTDAAGALAAHSFAPRTLTHAVYLLTREARQKAVPTADLLQHVCRCGWRDGFIVMLEARTLPAGADVQDAVQWVLQFLAGPATEVDRASVCQWLWGIDVCRIGHSSVPGRVTKGLHAHVELVGPGPCQHSDASAAGLAAAGSEVTLAEFKKHFPAYSASASTEKTTGVLLQFLKGPASAADRSELLTWLNTLREEPPLPAPMQALDDEAAAGGGGAAGPDADDGAKKPDTDIMARIPAIVEEMTAASAAAVAAAAAATQAADALAKMVAGWGLEE